MNRIDKEMLGSGETMRVKRRMSDSQTWEKSQSLISARDVEPSRVIAPSMMRPAPQKAMLAPLCSSRSVKTIRSRDATLPTLETEDSTLQREDPISAMLSIVDVSPSTHNAKKIPARRQTSASQMSGSVLSRATIVTSEMRDRALKLASISLPSGHQQNNEGSAVKSPLPLCTQMTSPPVDKDDLVGKDFVFNKSKTRDNSSATFASAISSLFLLRSNSNALRGDQQSTDQCDAEAAEKVDEDLLSVANTSISSITDQSSVHYQPKGSASRRGIQSILGDLTLVVQEKVQCLLSCDCANNHGLSRGSGGEEPSTKYEENS